MKTNKKEEFLEAVASATVEDRHFYTPLSDCRLKVEDGKKYAFVDAKWVELWEEPETLRCFYERSGEDMRANQWLPVETQFEIMNKYCFPNLDFSKRGLAIIRDDKLLALHSSRYEYYSQITLINAFFEGLKANNAAVTFMNGSFENNLTRCEVRVDHADLLTDYQRSAIKAGYNDFIRKGSFISFVFCTNDVGTCDVEVFPVLHVAGKSVFMDNNIGTKPFSIIHKDASLNTALANFDKGMQKLFVTAKIEAENIGKLMSIPVVNPEKCIEKCIKRLKLKNLSARGLEEFTNQLVYTNLDSAFQVYLTMYDFLQTPTVSSLGREKREKIARVIRTLVVEDWDKLK